MSTNEQMTKRNNLYSKMRISPSQKWQLTLTITASVLLGVFFFSTVSFDKVMEDIRNIDLRWFVVAALFMLLNNIIRALRIRAVIQQYIPLVLLTATCSTQSFLGMFLPSGLAQASFVYLFKLLHMVGVLRSAIALVSMRLVDLIVLSAIALSLGFYLDIDSINIAVQTSKIAGLIIVAAIVGAAFYRLFLRKKKLIILSKIILLIDDAINQFIVMGKVLTSFRPIIYTLLLLFSLFGCYAFTCLSIGVIVTPLKAVFAFSLLMLINLLPAHGVAGVGTHHLIWYLVLTAAGVEHDKAIVASTASHILLLGLYTIWMIPSFPFVIFFSIRNSRKADSNNHF